MKAIQTKYKGYKFRSRLEARWAVFFDSLKIKWEYEKEGYHFEDGTNYLPDFWLPEVKMWAEVKGTDFNEEEIKKAKNLAIGSKHPVLMLIGTPERKTYFAFCVDWDSNKISEGEFILSNYHNYPKEEGRFYCMPSEGEVFEEWFDDLERAVNKAREARFEFNGV